MKGFKETEIGWVPDDWEVKRLDSFAETKSGGTPHRKIKDYYNGNILWIKSGELKDNYIGDSEEKISQEAIKNSSAKLFPEGTILIAMYGATVGKTAILKKEATTNQAICGILPKRDFFNNDFLRYSFVFNRAKLLVQRYGGAQPNISQTIIKQFEIAFPPLPEQKSIARILSTIQQSIEKQQAFIGLTTELKKAMMHKLFTEGTKREPQKETEIGLVPESWEIVKLEDTVNFTTGKLNSNAAEPDGIYPFFTCSQETFRINIYAFDQEAILLSGNNARAIYSVKHYKGKFNAYQRTYVITLKDIKRFDYIFFKYALSCKLEFLRRISIGTSTRYLTLGLLKNTQISMPNIKIQKQVGELLQKIEDKIDIQILKKQHYVSLFKTMLHELMTGKIRVKEIKL